MTTTIEADVRYTHLISNGNISHASNPTADRCRNREIPPTGDNVRESYSDGSLSVSCLCGNLGHACRFGGLPVRTKCSSGVSRATRMTESVRIPMEILKESVLWIEKTQDYEYNCETYRTICMNKSNFGGMENVGNTTIVTDAAIITEHTLDAGLLYAHAVIVHEFEHNQCGSETTMETPFDVWLNEAYTVDVERQFMADMFNPAYVRLNQVESIRNPLLGPLAIEDSGYAGRIVREGFNDPEELIDGVTYVKAAEVIRMLRLLLGAEQFRAGKRLYFSRYHNANADTSSSSPVSRKCRAAICGSSGRVGFIGPVTRKYLRRRRTMQLRNAIRSAFRRNSAKGRRPFTSRSILRWWMRRGRYCRTARTCELKESSAVVVFDGIDEEPAFASLNRDYSFYGTFVNRSATKKTLALQATTRCQCLQQGRCVPSADGYRAYSAHERPPERYRPQLARPVRSDGEGYVASSIGQGVYAQD